MAYSVETAAMRLGSKMRSAEASLSTALIDATSLLHEAAVADSTADGAPDAEVHAAFLNLQKSVSSLLEARGRLTRTHAQLLTIGREMGATEDCYPSAQEQVFDGPRLVNAR